MPDFINGHITMDHNMETIFGVGARVLYSCDSGYHLAGFKAGTGVSNARVCEGDGSSSEGKWSGENPVCVRTLLTVYHL